MASRGVNKVILVGNLGQDPEVRYMPSGGAVANFTLATSESWRDKQTGEMKEQTEWHRVVLFGKLAEVAGEYLRKGSQVYIEGQLRTRKWQDKDHSRRSHFPSLTMRFTRCNENKAPSGAFLMRVEVRPSRNAPRRRTRPDLAYPTDSHDTQGRCILRGWTCLPGFLAAVKQTSLPR